MTQEKPNSIFLQIIRCILRERIALLRRLQNWAYLELRLLVVVLSTEGNQQRDGEGAKALIICSEPLDSVTQEARTTP